MFYSQTFLARKSPLGTVWIAAHLQHKLRKSHVVVTDISSSVDHIMFPEVPIALRLSGHLLLGVVRIYSKKVDYLFQDCNEFLTKIRSAFASVQVNLPEDATHAPFQSITLPETFDLDALELDDMIYQTQDLDNHLKTFEEITLVEQIPAEGDPYVSFFVDEDIPMDTSPVDLPGDGAMMGTSLTADLTDDGARPMEEDIPPPLSRDNAAGCSDSGPVHAAEDSNQKLLEGHFHEDPPQIEVCRDAAPLGPGNIPDLPDFGDNIVEQHEHFYPNITQKEFLSPIMEGPSASGGESLLSCLHPDLPTFRSAGEPENFGSGLPSGPALPELGIQPTPPVEQKKAKSRKRKKFFDSKIVIENNVMKNQLQDAGSLQHKRRKLPVSTLDIWRYQKIHQMDRTILEPSLSGMSADLREVFFRMYTASKVPSLQPWDADAPPQPTDAGSPGGVPFSEMEIEHARFEEGYPDGLGFGPSHSGREEATPSPARNLESGSQVGKFLVVEALPTPELSGYASPAGPESGTPRVPSQERLPVEVTSLPHLPEILRSAEFLTPHQGQQFVREATVPGVSHVLNSAEAEELNFLEAENSAAQAGGPAESDVGTLSVRTRAVAQYLQRQTPASQVSEDPSGQMSLNRILEGKTRKQCVRMFFETLVLKNYGFVDVQQKEAYGNITLTLTPALSKAIF